MKLSSAYLFEQLEKVYRISGCAGLSEYDGYLRPFFYCRAGQADNGTERERVCVVLPEDQTGLRMVEGIFYVLCETVQEASERDNSCADREKAFPDGCAELEFSEQIGKRTDTASGWACGDQGTARESSRIAYVRIALPDNRSAAGVLNVLQQIFDRCEEWERSMNMLLVENAGVTGILELAGTFLENPLMVMGLDFSLFAESGSSQLPQRAQLFTEDGINIEYMNALLQDEGYRKLAETDKTVLFPAYISGCRSLNRNLSINGQPTHRLIMTECRTALTPGDVCLMEVLAGRLEYLLAHEASASRVGDMEQIFVRILSDRTADYMQISHQLAALGWGTGQEYLCLVLQLMYLNQKQLSTKAICRHIRKQFPDSVSFLYQDEIVTFFNLSRLGLKEDEVASKLIYFIRDSYLKAGYSRTMQGHMNLRRQYVQARMALDVGSRKKPYLWIHHFNQVALPYIMEQATRRLPGTMLCHEGLLKLKAMDEKNHTEYIPTLKAYLEQHLGATQAAKQLFIHRSTFLYRLERIREILQSDLDDADELFYLELSLRLLEQEEEKETGDQ